MAIARDTSTKGWAWGGGTTTTFSHTCSGTNRLLIVGAIAPAVLKTVTWVTYNSVAMTKISSVNTTNTLELSLWALVAPDTWTNNVIITWTGNGNYWFAVSYTGAKQSWVPDAFNNTATSNTNSFSPSVTTIADNCWAVGIVTAENGTAVTAGSNTTILQAEVTNYGSLIADTWSAKTPAWTDTMNFTATIQQFTAILASIAPFVAVTARGHLSLLWVS